MDSRVGSGEPLLEVPRGVEHKWGQVREEDIPLEVTVTLGKGGMTLAHVSPSYTSRMLLRALKNNSEEFTDAAIMVNNKILRVHSWVMSTFSTAMKAAFCQAPKIFHAQMEGDLVASLVDCMYGKPTAIRESQLCRFLGVSRQLGMACFDTPGLHTLEDNLLARERRGRAGKPGGQVDVQDEPVLKHKESQEAVVHQQNNQILHYLMQTPGLTLTPVNDKPNLHDQPVVSNQTEGGISTEEPQQRDKKQCCCNCSCKKKTEDISGAAQEAEKGREDPNTMSLATKLKTLGTTITGQRVLVDLPSWIFSNNSLSITPASTRYKSPVTTRVEKPEILAHSKFNRSHQQDSPIRAPHPDPPIDQPGKPGRDVGKGVMPRGMMVGAGHHGQGQQHGVGARHISSGMRPGGGFNSVVRDKVNLTVKGVRQNVPEVIKNSAPVSRSTIPQVQQHSKHIRHQQNVQQTVSQSRIPQVQQHSKHIRHQQNVQQTVSRSTIPQVQQHSKHIRYQQNVQQTVSQSRIPQVQQHTEHIRHQQNVQQTVSRSRIPQVQQHSKNIQQPQNAQQTVPVFQSRIPQVQQHLEHSQHPQNVQQTALPAKVSLPGVPHEHQKPKLGRNMRGRGRCGRDCPQQVDVVAALPVPLKTRRGRPMKNVPVHHNKVVGAAETTNNNLLTLDEANSFEIVETGLILQLADGDADIFQDTASALTVQLPESLEPESNALPQPLQHTQHQEAVGPENSALPQHLQHTQHQEAIGPENSALPQHLQHTQHQEAIGPENSALPQHLQHTQHQEAIGPENSALPQHLQHTQHQEAIGPENSALPQHLQHTQHQEAIGPENSALPQHLQHTQHQEAVGPENSVLPQHLQHTQHQEAVRLENSALPQPLQHTQHQEAVGLENSAAPQPLQHTQHQEAVGLENSAAPQPLQHTQHQEAVGLENSAAPQPLQHTQHQEAVGLENSAAAQPLQHTQHQEAVGLENSAAPQPLQHTQHQEAVGLENSAAPQPLQHTQHQEAVGLENNAAPQPLQHTQHQEAVRPENSAVPQPLQHTQHQEAVGLENNAAPQPVQHTQPPLSSEAQDLASGKTRASSFPRVSFSSRGESSSFEGFFVSDEESVQDKGTAVTLPSQASPRSSMVQQCLDIEKGEQVSQYLDSEEELPPLYLDSGESQLSLSDTQAPSPQPALPVKKSTPAKKQNHTCPTCHLNFSTSPSLLLHQRQHNGQNYFHCSSCIFYHYFRKPLEHHVRKKHGRGLMDTEKKRVRAMSVSPGNDEQPKKKVKKEECPKKRKLMRLRKRKY